MIGRTRIGMLAAIVAFAGACGGSDDPQTTPAPDAGGVVDAGGDVGVDAGDADTGPTDAGTDVAPGDTEPGADTGPAGDTAPDATPDVAPDAAPDAPTDATFDTPTEVGRGAPGFGVITGECGVLDDELSAAGPSFVANRIDFGPDPFDDPDDLPHLTEGGREVIADGNAGGSSLYSEAFAYEVLARCEGAELLLTETEITYDAEGPITDLVIAVDDARIGVSVTRAVGWPRDDPYTPEQARALLDDKLADVLVSSANVSPDHAWEKQILHVIAYGEQHVESLRSAFAEVEPDVAANTIVIVTESLGDDGFLY